MRDEYDFTKGIKNPYIKKLKKQISINISIDVLDYFSALWAGGVTLGCTAWAHLVDGAICRVEELPAVAALRYQLHGAFWWLRCPSPGCHGLSTSF